MSSEQKVAAIGGVQRGGEARRQGKVASSGEWSVRGTPGSKEQELAPQREREDGQEAQDGQEGGVGVNGPRIAAKGVLWEGGWLLIGGGEAKSLRSIHGPDPTWP